MSPQIDLKLQPMTILCCNIRNLLGKITELMHLIEVQDVQLVFLQETWLDTSHEEIVLPNFTVLSRRDRAIDANRGGVTAYVRQDIKNMVHLMDAKIGERSWHLLHRDSGSVAFCN